MTLAVCFKCGCEKFGAFSACARCGAFPQTEDEWSLSLVLCEHLSSEHKLAHYSDEIRNGFRLAVPEVEMARARKALKNPRFMSMPGLERELKQAPRATRRPDSPEPEMIILDDEIKECKKEPPSGLPTPAASAGRHLHCLEATVLHRNAFFLLGATTRDDRRRIVELAEEKSLELDHEACQKARFDLTSPWPRLTVELAWLPGISPRKATQLTRQVLQDPMSIRRESGLPFLAHANLMAIAFEAVGSEDDPQDVSKFIQEMACLVEKLTPDDIIREVNQDRAVSGFPEVRAKEKVEAEIGERKRYFKDAIIDALNRIPAQSLVEVMTLTVIDASSDGKHQAPELLDELVDSYEVQCQNFLHQEAENVRKLIRATLDSASSGETAVEPLVDKLEIVARNWVKVAKPIQLSAKTRGKKHDLSHEMAYPLRSLAVDLFNKQDMLAQSRRIIALLRELFPELPELAEQVEQDADVLQDIFQSRKQAEARWNEWAREISYSAEIGMVFKNTLSISTEGLVWKGRRYPLDAITRVRWGGVKHYRNGIPTGTTYTIAFGDSKSESVVEVWREEVYSTFLDKLWRAVCVRLLTELLEALKAGKEIRIGEAVLRDEDVLLVKHKFLGSNETIRCAWNETNIWSADGRFYIGRQGDKKIYVGLSYINTPNTHILEQAIRMAFKKPGIRKLSDVLN